MLQHYWYERSHAGSISITTSVWDSLRSKDADKRSLLVCGHVLLQDLRVVISNVICVLSGDLKEVTCITRYQP